MDEKEKYVCTKCGGKEFFIHFGGSSCCAYVKVECVECKECESFDYGEGDC